MAEPSSLSSPGLGPHGGRIIVVATLIGNLIIAGIAHFVTGGKSIAEVWYQWDANSLVGLQALVEKKLDPNPEDPTIYFDVVLPILDLPFALAVLVIVLLFDIVPLIVVTRRLKRSRSALNGPIDPGVGDAEVRESSEIRKE